MTFDLKLPLMDYLKVTKSKNACNSKIFSNKLSREFVELHIQWQRLNTPSLAFGVINCAKSKGGAKCGQTDSWWTFLFQYAMFTLDDNVVLVHRHFHKLILTY